ncbi:sigma-70 family RNA polymerase sigma factor [Vogesella oryzae]|uniref:sigma-70 family RNA polymerase sigma factor n=1 Tax=Vogesella oryzae TaxID=1735285 RepID=UPI001581CF5C|nr:sigma-70 family RNA polymerase sigma factor [Vogesella oryzae]
MPSDHEIEAERPYLLRYARSQLQDAAAAEDAVQDTLLAALQGRERFAGGASLRTWLTSILRFKLIDVVRRQSRESTIDLGEDLDLADLDAVFDGSGHWAHAVRAWGAPEESLLAQQFWQVYQQCAQVMPKRTAMVFAMREVMDMDIAEICQNLDITATNCSVMLYRARLSLRECLEIRWFQREAT